jgi:Fe-S oxidoreductase
VDEARVEARRLVAALLPHARKGRPILGLEPSCLFTLRDEIPAMLPGGHTDTVSAHAMMVEEFLHAEASAERLHIPLNPLKGEGRILVHGHCHQKAFGTEEALTAMLRLIPDANVELVQSGCCGMAGAFGYEAEHQQVSMDMAELDLLPAVRQADPRTHVSAAGTSCRHQIADGAARTALHPVRLLETALAD